MNTARRYPILFALLPLLCCQTGISPVRAQTLPADAQSTCLVPAQMFNGWFKEGIASLNGTVNPANSVTFSNPANNCAFYQWSEQMFLWITSPAPQSYGGAAGRRVFESPVFFDVSAPDANGDRTFIKHEPNQVRRFNVRVAKTGPHRLPVILDKRGRMFEILPPQPAPSGKLQMLNQQSTPVEIDRVTVEKGKPVFRDKDNKVIAKPKAIVPDKLKKAAVVQKVLVGQRHFYVDAKGQQIDTEEGQADGSVLQTQNGSLVYYVTMVNDVYAYFLTGTKNGGITPKPTKFPTTQPELDKIVTFAAAHGIKFPDPQALAIEVKTAWVEAASLPNPGDYITMDAIIPTYETTKSSVVWTPKAGEDRKVPLALVGMHVVGSAAGHPEMIWATFEHFGNAPNAAYQYYATGGKNPKTVAQDTSGTWLFAAKNSAGPFNLAHMVFNDPNIEAAVAPNNPTNSPPPFTISPSDSMRMAPFGGGFDVSPNPLDTNTARSNTEVISINNSVIGQLGGDVRAKYYMLGATWTIGGAAPTTPFNNKVGNQVGTSQLANTTMETYQQSPSNAWSKGVNCFACHNTATVEVSHVFCTPFTNCANGLKPLFP